MLGSLVASEPPASLGEGPAPPIPLGVPSLPPMSATPAASLLSLELPASSVGLGSLMAILREDEPPVMAPPSLPAMVAPAPTQAGVVSPCVELLIRRVED